MGIQIVQPVHVLKQKEYIVSKDIVWIEAKTYNNTMAYAKPFMPVLLLCATQKMHFVQFMEKVREKQAEQCYYTLKRIIKQVFAGKSLFGRKEKKK